MEGEDYDDVFVAISLYTTIILVISHASSQGWTLHQMDEKNVFLHGKLQEEVFVEKPIGFEVRDMKTHVCRLKKELYGLK